MKFKLLAAFVSILVAFTPSVAQQKSVLTIAFGSCNRQDSPQPLWDDIAKDQPDLWIWLGDNIYGDSDDMTVLKEKYELQQYQEGYKKFTLKTPVIGVWDDHDFGRNDAGKEYPYKKQSQQLALDFLDEPVNSPRRKQEGIYAAYDYQAGTKVVKVILLDARYHRDSLTKDASKKNIPNVKGDILGEEQWQWLKSQLQTKADAYIIGSGIQFIAEEHPYEKWANFPSARKRFFDLIAETKAKGVILISGDRHIGEVSKITVAGVNYPIYDITSSGLTHSSVNNTSEKNQFRVGPLVNQKHYGIFRLSQQADKKLTAEVELKGENGKLFHKERIGIK